MNIRKTVLITILSSICFLTYAESDGFKSGKWMEIQNAIMRHLAANYVDSLPYDKMYIDAIDKMLSDLDPYTVFVPEEEKDDFNMALYKSYGGIGALISKPDKEGNVIINEPYEGSPAAKAGLRCSDEVMEIDGNSVKGLTVSECSSRMRGEAGSRLKLKVKKSITDEIIDIVIVREKIHMPDIQYSGMIDNQTGYILQEGFTDGVAKDVAEAIDQLKKKGMKRLVLDLRGNGGGLLSEAIKEVGLFVPRGTVVVTSKGKEGERQYKTENDPIDLTLPILVLVDSGSASASEIVSGALQDLDRATIAGRRTFGKGLVQSIVSLPYACEMKITTAKYYTPSGRCVQAIDYSKRNEDGSVGQIPDSLTHEFHTVSGRIVKDGGGITPDITLKALEYSRFTKAFLFSGLVDKYVVHFASQNASIQPIDNFRFTEKQYEEFIEWMEQEDFDDRSESQAQFDKLVAEMKKDGSFEEATEALSALEKTVNGDRKERLLKYRDEIIPFLEEEIASRYYFTKGRIHQTLKYDIQVKEALQKWQESASKSNIL